MFHSRVAASTPPLTSPIKPFMRFHHRLLQHCAAVSRDGSCFTWGCNASGRSVVPVPIPNVFSILIAVCRLGHGDEWPRWKPTQVTALASCHVTFVACGPASSAAIDSGGQLYLWGDNFCGQLIPCANAVQITGLEIEVMGCGGCGGRD
jgi:alpha-tubulin suppressor-like RCC1 family protein